MAAGSGPPKAEHRPEAIEEQQLVQVVAHFLAVRAVHDFVLHHAAVGIHTTSTSRSFCKSTSGCCISGKAELGRSEGRMRPAGCNSEVGISLGSACTTIPGTIMCSTNTKMTIAENNPPVAGTVKGRNTLSCRISTRSFTSCQRSAQLRGPRACAAATL